MQDIMSCAVGVDAFASARWSGMDGALAGFPVSALLDEWLRAGNGEAAARRRAKHLVAHVLTVWANTIEHDLEHLPPATSEVLQINRQHMVDARSALLQLLALLDGWYEVAPNPGEPDDALMTRAGRSVDALGDAPGPLEEALVPRGSPPRVTTGAGWSAGLRFPTPAREVASASA